MKRFKSDLSLFKKDLNAIKKLDNYTQNVEHPSFKSLSFIWNRICFDSKPSKHQVTVI